MPDQLLSQQRKVEPAIPGAIFLWWEGTSALTPGWRREIPTAMYLDGAHIMMSTGRASNNMFRFSWMGKKSRT